MKINSINSRWGFFLASLVFFIVFEIIFFYKLVQVLNISHIVWIKVYIILSSIFLLSRPIMTLFYKDDHSKSSKKNKNWNPKISIVIPAKDEEDSIYKTIKTSITSEYLGEIECVLINDGSGDNTLKEMFRAKKELENPDRRTIKIINFEKNLGKREGMSAGIRESDGEIIIFVDSDSFLNRDSIPHIISHFKDDPRLGAISGNTLVENRETFLAKMQSARYAISFDIFKACESIFGVVSCCPGCFSAYRRDAIDRIIENWRNRHFLGSRATFGDDRSMTNYILKDGWKVTYCRKAKATTIVPDTYKKFIKQQLRWKKSWIREGLFGAATFMWKKHPVAAIAFYTNLIIPFIGPFIVLTGLIFKIISGEWLNVLIFIISVTSMSFAYGLFTYALTKQKDFIYSIPFTIFYSFILVWQMPWAIIRIKDTRWGTR